MKKKIDIISIFMILTIVAIAIYSSSTLTKQVDIRRKGIHFEQAKVLEIFEEKISEDRNISGIYLGHQVIEIEILTGKYKGEIQTIRNPMGRTYNVHTKEDMKVIVSIYGNEDEIENLQVYSYKRSSVIFSLIALFFVIMIAIGRKKGLKSILSLIFTVAIIIFFMIPQILKGKSPILLAIITAILSSTVTFYMISSWSKKTLAAIIGTVLGVSIAGAISYYSGILAFLSGMTMENSEQLMYIADDTGMQVRGLMFATILIASLGAIMDVAMSIASSTFEINRINKNLATKELFESAMNVGRDIIGTMSNTLILAFAGGMFSMLIIIVAYRMPYNQMINLDLISIEIIQALAGSIGIVLTVPITAISASILANK